jgi:hypothetical protein
MVLKAIEMQVGGTALATANDSDKMKVAFSQLSESIGLTLLPLFQKFTAIMLKGVAICCRKHHRNCDPGRRYCRAGCGCVGG